MCKIMKEFKVAYEDFQTKAQAQNVIIESLELKAKRLEEECEKLHRQIRNKENLISLYEKTIDKIYERADIAKSHEAKKFEDWKLSYRLKWKWGICAVGLVILFLEINQLIMFMK